MESKIATTERGSEPIQIILPGEFEHLFVPSGYQEGITNYANAVLSRRDQELESKEGFAEILLGKMQKINEYAGEQGLKGMVILVPYQPLETTIAVSDEFRPDNVAETWIHDLYHIDNDTNKPLKPEFSSIMGKTYNDGDVTLALALVLMSELNRFGSMVRGQGQCYDDKNENLKCLNGYENNKRTMVDDMRDLSAGQRAADLQIALMIDGQRRAIRQTGSSNVPNTPFATAQVLTPIDVDTENNGRIKTADGALIIPCVATGWSGSRRPGLNWYGGGAYSKVGWIAVDELPDINMSPLS